MRLAASSVSIGTRADIGNPSGATTESTAVVGSDRPSSRSRSSQGAGPPVAGGRGTSGSSK